MSEEMVRNSRVAVVVRDLDPVLDLYGEGLGLGPFEIQEIDAPGARLGGVAAPARLRVATAPLGVCEMELIEVVAGRPPHQEFLEEQGEGMNHFNLDKCSPEAYLETLGRLYGRGIEPFWGYPFNSFCYVDTARVGGVTFEVMVGSGHAGKKGHNHLGLVVANTQRTIAFYRETLGLGPFRSGVFPMQRAFYRDARIETSFRASFCDIGEARLEVFQVLEGDTPLGAQLEARGEGMHHLALVVPEPEKRLEELAARGIEATWECPEAGLTLLDTRAVGGMTFAIAGASA